MMKYYKKFYKVLPPSLPYRAWVVAIAGGIKGAEVET